MKRIIFLACLFFTSHFSFCQDIGYCVPQYPDSATVFNLPWFGKNQFLYDYLNSQGYYNGNPQARTSSCAEKFTIPLNVWIYQDNSGNPSSSISLNTAQEILRLTNELFINANTRIRFYVKQLTFVPDNFSRTSLSNPLEASFMFANRGLANGNDEFNVHFIRNTTGNLINTQGQAALPMFPNIPGSFNSCFVRTHSNFNGAYLGSIEASSTLAHELGHTLGLLHTHHPGRLPSLIFNSNNATISNDCYQESVSRVKANYWYNGCFSTDTFLKCEVNGDFLKDTQADPNVGTGGFVTSSSQGCAYVWTNGDGDYRADNWNTDWTPPTRNIMSYSSTDCRKEFSLGQIGIMWYYSNTFFQNYPAAILGISGPANVGCSSNSQFDSPLLLYPTSYNWSVPSNIQIVSGQGTGSVQLRSLGNGTSIIYLDITTPYGVFCFQRSVNASSQLPPSPSPISYNELCPEHNFSTTYQTGVTYTWQYYLRPSGPVTTFPNSANSKKITFPTNGNYRVGVQMVNGCGAGPITFIDITNSCLGGGKRVASVFPNPAKNELTVTFAKDSTNNGLTRVQLINKSMMTVFNLLTREKSIAIPTSTLEDGIYYLQITEEDGLTKKHQVIVKH